MSTVAAMLSRRNRASAFGRDLVLGVALGAAGHVRSGRNGGAASGGTRLGSVAMKAFSRVFQVSSSF
jgi:hypothetical protein